MQTSVRYSLFKNAPNSGYLHHIGAREWGGAAVPDPPWEGPGEAVQLDGRVPPLGLHLPSGRTLKGHIIGGNKATEDKSVAMMGIHHRNISHIAHDETQAGMTHTQQRI